MESAIEFGLKLIPGAIGVVLAYLGYIAVTKGLPAAKAKVVSWWTAAKNDVAKIKGDVAALEGRIATVEQKVGIVAPAKPATAPAAPAAH